MPQEKIFCKKCNVTEDCSFLQEEIVFEQIVCVCTFICNICNKIAHGCNKYYLEWLQILVYSIS